MEIPTGQQKDWPHRFHDWALANRTLLIWVLVGGIGFFGLLAGVTLWRESQQTQTNTALFALLDSARHAQEESKWEECVSRFEAVYPKAAQPFFKVLALHGKAACLTGKGSFVEAAKTFERASQEPGHVDPLVSRFEALRLYQMAGEPDMEERYLNLLKEKNLSRELKNKIEEELLWLKIQKGS